MNRKYIVVMVAGLGYTAHTLDLTGIIKNGKAGKNPY
jgi:hypothetical protein